jgi:hypothetical protein
VENERATERGDVVAIMEAMADINVNVARILWLLETALEDEDGEEEEA